MNKVFIDHYVAQCWGINSKVLNSPAELLKKSKIVTGKLNLTIVNSFTHRFKPHGLSLILVIAESHLAIHTWPELGYMNVDVLSCSPTSQLINLKMALQEEFNPQKIESKKISY